MIVGVVITRNLDQAIETKGSFNVMDDSGATVMSIDSLELPNKGNAAEVSCIPCGVYTCIKVPASHIPYEHIAVENVPNRSGIAIHIGNFAAGAKVDFEGCIGVGDRFADINKDGIDDLADSRATFLKLMAILPNTFKLTIK